MKNQIFTLTLLLSLAVSGPIFGQNVGIGEPNPGSTLSVKGGMSVGTTYSTSTAPTGGLIIEGRMGVGTSNPDTNAIIDMSGAVSKGIKMPRTTAAQRSAIANPSKGLMLFDTDSNNVYFHNGTAWTPMLSLSSVTNLVSNTVSSLTSGLLGGGSGGTTWYTGSGAPGLLTSGSTGDYYINTANGNYYEKTSAISWTLEGCLMGPTGSAGSAGAAGAAGARGATGVTGATGTNGTNGAVGATGAAGTNGTNGTNGAAGATGAAGAAGAAGATGAGYYATSATSLTIASSGNTPTITTQSGLAYVVGSRVRILYQTTPTDYMEGTVASYSGTNMVITITNSSGSGTFASWYITLAGNVGAAGTNGTNGTAGATGATGTAGTNGAAGATGPTGAQGIQGVTGAAGTNGTNGAAGATGAAGANGTNGAAGATGPTGAQGSQGATGAAGTNGTNGTNGAAGATGATGAVGTNGTNGAVGATGAQGIQGVTGATGAAGTNGAVGATGAQGIQGATGAAGTNGTNGAVGATGAQGIQGATGAQGIQGATGAAGTNGTNGAVGATGAQGIQGATGAQGIQGATGAAGTNGTNGAVGATGAAGTNGTNGAVGATGAAGTNGTNGATGAQGAGYYATSATSLTIASSGNTSTITTQSGLAYVAGDRVRIFYQTTPANYMEGTIASYSGTNMVITVTNSGGSGTYALWYISETGNVGATGAAGTNGTNGAAGATGPTGAAGTNGTNGTNGVTGATGAAGTNGTNGATGATGAAGTNGTNGAAGATGPTGAAGAAGAAGLLSAGSVAGNTPYWNGSSWVVNSSNIYNNGGNVGIGTTSPSGLFSVGNGSPFIVDNSGNVTIGTNGSLTINSLVQGDALFINNGKVSQNSNFYWDNGNGRLGVGTNSPSSLFSVGNASAFQIDNSSNVTIGTNGSLTINSLVQGDALFINNGKVTQNNSFYWDNGNARLGIGTNSPSNTFSVGSSSQFQVNISGNIQMINNVSTSFPSSQGAANSYLKNDGSGNLTWATGAMGATGATGAAGSNGSNGATGATGATGAAGTNGTNGAVGATGPAGTNGTNGAVGATGAAGTNGTNGATGAQGAGYYATSATSLTIASSGNTSTITTQSGLAYVAGDRVRIFYQTTPADYMEGTVASYSGTSMIITVTNSGGSGTFASWYISETGNVGATGAAGTNGAVGATGATGAAGTNGAVGATGATGPAGANGANGAVGATGAAGTNGTNGAVGATGAAGTNGTNGAVGATGAAGAAGAAGTNGSTWITGTVAPTGGQGNINDLYLNTSTDVYYIKTAATTWTQKNDLDGVTGATGATGANGATGPTGAAGTNGTNGAVGATGAAGSAGAAGAAGATGPTGSLSAGSAAGNTPYWNGTSWVLNSSNIYNDGANIGIGTTSPSNKLQVNDGGIAISNDNNTAGALYFYEPSTSGTNYMAFKAQAMTANVTYTLPAADGTSGQVLSTNGSGTLSWSAGGTSGWGLTGNSINAGTNFIGTTNNTSFRVRTNNVEHLTVDSLGNVGIGTTTPGTGLWVVDNYSGKNVATMQNTNVAGYSSIDFWNNTGALSTTFGYANSGTGNFFQNTAYMNCYGNNFVLTSNSGNYNIFIQGSSGNVGINTNTPENTFDVSGNMAIGSYAGSNTAPTNGLLVSGDVSIGNDNDFAVLDVVASGGQDVLLGGGSTNGSEIKFLNFGNEHFSIYNNGASNASGNNYLTFANTSPLAQTNNAGTSLMVLDQNGYLGIGTTNPLAMLSIGSSSQFRVSSTGNITKINNVTTSFPSSQGSSNTYLKNDGSGNLTWSTVSGSAGPTGPTGPAGATGATGPTGATGAAGSMASGSAAGNTPYWNGSSWVVNSSNIYNDGGNVGIGMTSPNSTFEVNGGIATNMTTESGSTAITLDNTASVWYFTGSAGATLPAASSSNSYRKYTIVNRTNSSKTISSCTSLSGGSTVTLAANSSIDVISTGSAWVQIR